MTTATEHRIKVAVQLSGAKGKNVVDTFGKFIIECECGWTSPVIITKRKANDAWIEHKTT